MNNTNSTAVFNKIHTSADVEVYTWVEGIRAAISRPQKAPFAFSSLVASANLGTFFDGSVLLEMQVSNGLRWSPFFKLGFVSESFQRSFPDQVNAWGEVKIDELVLAKPMRYYRLRVRMEGKVPLLSFGVSGVSKSFQYVPDQAAVLPSGSFEIDIHPISQKEQDTVDNNRICSPTSLCMALNALGRPIALSQVLQNVYDPASDIFGNWFFNTAYASQQKLDVHFWRFHSLSELSQYCNTDALVVASIAYKEGELPQAAQPQSDGHLLVIRGWKDGQVLVADPAAPTAEQVLRAYDAKSFAQVWLQNKQGASYILRRR
ncbi:MAG: C39 family peptidase [Elusimicrobiaceae bacterium]|nr:C39 family peptidase [Elusimicrobiaceae bacterium]